MSLLRSLSICSPLMPRRPLRVLGLVAAAGGMLSLAACSNPYDPGQRALGGGLIGAGGGAAIGALAGGGRGAAIGALAGGAVGAATGAATTPQRPYYPQQGYAPPPPPPPPGYYGRPAYPPPPPPPGYYNGY
ncbi:cell envelope biogenesis protein OmpA [Nguyenibacter vanlangensis]|uniref:Cell envelope biogenesis protein OmpA n=1 Tax=Nguyenibacter vanlangensis TaxID=1216886 RepID=A0ABZ3D7K3_9PROT